MHSVPSTRFGHKAIIISTLCLVGWLLLILLATDMLGLFSYAVYFWPLVVIGDVVALVYAFRGLGAARDERRKAWLAILFASPVLILIVTLLVALSGGVKLYQ